MPHSEESTETTFRNRIGESLGRWVAPGSRSYQQNLEFATARFAEGQQLAAFFKEYRMGEWPQLVLDVGSGNGGVSIGVAEDQSFRVVGVDVLIQDDFYALRRQLDLPVGQVGGSGEALPFRDDTFDIVLCLETIEHVPDPRGMAEEIMRILKPGGTCMVTTPARLRYLLAPDPHYAIRSLLLLPDNVQEWIVTSVLKRTDRYDVTHVFWHVRGIASLFPEPHSIVVLWNHPRPYRSRIRNGIWWYFRNMLWDRILISKPA